MREQLVGYLLHALEDEEVRTVEALLADPRQGESLRSDLNVLRKAVAPLARDGQPLRPPIGLAARTLAFVADQTSPATVPLRPLSPSADGPVPARRPWLDRALIAASALAACILVVPLVGEAIIESRARRVEPPRATGSTDWRRLRTRGQRRG